MKNKPTTKILYSLILNAAFLLIALLVFHPFFEEIDDTHIAMISEGAYGIREWHLIYPNVLLGRLYVLLSALMPMVRWHVVIQYAFIFMAYFMLVYILCKHKNGYLLSFVIVLSTFYEMYVSLQYTKTASFVCITAILLTFSYVRNCRKLKNMDDTVLKQYSGTDETARLLKAENIFFIIFTFIFVIYGSLLRRESFFIACVPAVFLGFLELYRTRRFLDYLKIIVPMFAAVFAGILYNDHVYSADDEWSFFMQYNKARSEFTDYRYDLLDFTRYSDELNALGLSENDAVMILTYQFGDDNVFSNDRFREIRAAFPAHKAINDRVFRTLYGNVRDEVTKPNVYIYALILFVVMLIASIVVDRSKSNAEYISESRAKCIAMIFTGISCASALFYFHYSGRFSHRLTTSLVIPAILSIVYMLDNEFLENDDRNIVFAGNKKDITGHLLILAAVVTIALNIFMYFINKNEYNALAIDTINTKAVETLKLIGSRDEDDACLFVADTFTFQNAFKYDIFKPSTVGEYKNFVSCGSWFMNSPVTKNVTRSFGFENPYEALLSQGDNVVLLDDVCSNDKLVFLKEHYDSTYELEETNVIGGVTNYIVK